MDSSQKLSSAIGGIRGVQDALQNLAYGFELIGNDTLSDQLVHLKNRLEFAQKLIHEATIEIADARLKDAQAASTNVLRAALAGAFVNPDDVIPLKD